MPITLADTEAPPPRQQGGPPQLRLRRIAIDTYHEAVAYLPRRCTVLRPEDFQALAKIEVHNGHRRIMAVLNIVEQEEMLRPDEIGLSQHAFALLGAAEGTVVEVQQANHVGGFLPSTFVQIQPRPTLGRLRADEPVRVFPRHSVQPLTDVGTPSDASLGERVPRHLKR